MSHLDPPGTLTRAFPQAFLNDRTPRTITSKLVDNALLQRRARGWELGLPVAIDPRGRQVPLIIAVGGGKGGVGKSLVSANLALELAARGLKTVAVDLDIGGANLHTYFALQPPAVTLADVVVLRQKSLESALVQTPVQGVKLLAGGREEVWGGAAAFDQGAMRDLFDAIFRLRETGEADAVVLDLGAGSSRTTVDFFAAAHLGLVTALPEPTSIENAYGFLKATLFAMIDNVGARGNAQEVAGELRALLTAPDSRGGGYTARLSQAAALYPGLVSQLSTALQGRVVGIAVNQIRCQNDIDVGKSMELIGERYFGLNCRYCGYLNYDEAAWKALRNRRMLAVDFPHSGLTRRLKDLAQGVLANLGISVR